MKKILTIVCLALTSSGAIAADTYTIEPNHTYPSFEAPHLGISFWRGKFTKTEGNITLDRVAKTGALNVTIDANQIDFGHAKMNEHAKGPDFFNVEKFPKITYVGKSVKFNGETPVAVEGELTLLGVTKSVPLTINSFKCREHPFFKREVCGADAVASFKRSEFGMNYGVAVNGDDIKLQIQVEALKN